MSYTNRILVSAVVLAGVAVVALNWEYVWLNIRQAVSNQPETSGVTATWLAPTSARAATELPQAVKPIELSRSDLRKIPIGIARLNGADADADRLPDALEKILGTDPQKADTDSDGFSDSAEIKVNRDPLSLGKLPISISFTSRYLGTYVSPKGVPDELWYVDKLEARRYYVPTLAAVALESQAPLSTATNQALPKNVLSISSLKLEAPIVYVHEMTEAAFQAGLQRGVVRYPGTAKPGALGNVYIFGHSSDYRTSKGSYKNIFATLPQIKLGAEVTLTDGKGTPYTYKVIETKVVSAKAMESLDQYDYARRLLTLQTSWPIGTALKRYVVIAELVE